MKVLQEGHVPVPWWLNQILSCRCGWTAQLEKGDELHVNVELSATSASARCGTCGEIVTVLRSTVEGKAKAAPLNLTPVEQAMAMAEEAIRGGNEAAPLSEEELRRKVGFGISRRESHVAMLREDQLRHFTNCPRFDESPLKEMFQKEGQ